MNTEESRKQFELSGLTSSLYRNNEPGRYDEYEDPFTQFAWRAWQAAQPQWIPVSEQMPEYGVAVFVVIDGIFKLIPFKRVCFGGLWWWESVISSTCMLYDISDVTHWMPLPEPPTNQEVE